MRLVALELGAVAAMAGCERVLGLVRQLVGLRLGIDLNVRILEKAEKLALRHFEDAEFYDKLTRARREASTRPLSLIQSNFQVDPPRADAGGVRRAADSLLRAGWRWRCWSRRCPRSSPRPASRARRSGCATGARPTRAG